MTGRAASDWRAGAVAGIVGAICYTVFVELVNVIAHGIGSFFFPFRQIGAVVLGPGAMKAGYNLAVATLVGTVVHFAIAALFGILIALIATQFAAIRGGSLIALGVAAGVVFYGLNVFVIFPVAFPWFLDNSRLTQSLGHAMFGGVTAVWLVLKPSTGTGL